MEAISYRQSIFLLSLILPVTGHMLLLPPIFRVSSSDAWAAILFTVPIGLLFGFILFRLHTLHPEKTLVEMLEQAFGRIAGKVLTIGLLGYFFYMLIVTLYALADFIQVIFLPETPEWVIAIPFYLVVLYAIYLGIESITRITEPLFLIIIFTGSSIAIATQPDKDYSILLPLFEKGFMPALMGIFMTTALFGEFVLLLMLKLKKDYAKSKSFLFTNSAAVFLITWMFVGTTISSLTIFGEAQVKNLEYPAQSVTRLVSFGVIERFDIYGIAVMVVGSVVRMSTFQFIFNLGMRQWLGIGHKWWIHGVITVTVFVLAMLGIRNHQIFMEFFLIKAYPLTAIISVGLPFLTWIVLEIKNRLVKGKKSGSLPQSGS